MSPKLHFERVPEFRSGPEDGGVTGRGVRPEPGLRHLQDICGRPSSPHALLRPFPYTPHPPSAKTLPPTIRLFVVLAGVLLPRRHLSPDTPSRPPHWNRE